jgi:YegS/Rv2252/BmrU family lipid kinase
LFVYNPISGGKKKIDIKQVIEDYCKANNIEARFFETTGNDDKESLRRDFIEIKPDGVIAIGGDGTVNLAGVMLVGTKTPLGIIPQGSANGLARDLNIPEDINEALALIRLFRVHPIDTIKINNRDAFHLSDFGFNARIVHRFSESFMRGKISYAYHGLLEFFSFKPFSYFIETPNFKYEGKAFMMIVTNSNQFGTSVMINPLGDIDDGYFEIVVLKPFSRFVAPYILYKLLKNSIHRTRYSKVIRCKTATIINHENESFHIDGEPVNLDERIEVKIVPRGLYVIRP